MHLILRTLIGFFLLCTFIAESAGQSVREIMPSTNHDTLDYPLRLYSAKLSVTRFVNLIDPGVGVGVEFQAGKYIHLQTEGGYTYSFLHSNVDFHDSRHTRNGFFLSQEARYYLSQTFKQLNRYENSMYIGLRTQYRYAKEIQTSWVCIGPDGCNFVQYLDLEFRDHIINYGMTIGKMNILNSRIIMDYGAFVGYTYNEVSIANLPDFAHFNNFSTLPMITNQITSNPHRESRLHIAMYLMVGYLF